MSRRILLGALRAPTPTSDDPLAWRQLQRQARRAADVIELQDTQFANLQSQVAQILSDYQALRDHVGGCTDGGCLIKRPTGMHTNGGCKCHLDKLKAQRMLMAGQRLHGQLSALVQSAEVEWNHG